MLFNTSTVAEEQPEKLGYFSHRENTRMQIPLYSKLCFCHPSMCLSLYMRITDSTKIYNATYNFCHTW